MNRISFFASAVISAVSFSASGLMLSNGSFEAVKDGKPEGWRIVSPCYRVDSRGGLNGSSALVWESESPCAGSQSFLQDLSGWETGKTYRLSARVKTSGFKHDASRARGVKLSLNWYDSNGKWIAGAYTQDFVESDFEWAPVSVVSRKIPANAVRVGINCYVEKNCSGKVYFDDVKVEEFIEDPARFESILALRSSVSLHHWWLPRFDAKKALAEKEDFPVAFIGDSITHFWESKGSNVWAKNYASGPFKAINFGFSADRTEHVLWRIRHGQFGKCRPKAIVLMIGTNNTGHRDIVSESALDTVLGIKQIIEELQAIQPQAKIIVHPIFPRGATTNDVKRLRNDRVNQSLLEYLGWVKSEKVLFCDFNARLLDKDGVLSKEIAPDLLHPTEKGYEIWAEALKPYLEFALGISAVKPRRVRTLSAPTALDTTSPRTLNPIVKQYWLADCRKAGQKGDFVPDRRLTEKLAEVRGNRDRYYDVVMMGDSITHLFETGRGKYEWKRLSERFKVLNLGFGGDGCQHALWHALHSGFLDNLQTRVVTLMIGTNNRQASAEEVAEGIRLCVNAIRQKQPQAVVLLHPMIPRINPDLKWLREKNDKTNELIKPLADGEKVLWVDLRPIFENATPEKQKQLLPDGTHPNSEAYRFWREAVTPYFEKVAGGSNK